jgi:hypothetical protein
MAGIVCSEFKCSVVNRNEFRRKSVGCGLAFDFKSVMAFLIYSVSNETTQYLKEANKKF